MRELGGTQLHYVYGHGHESCVAGYVWPIVTSILGPPRERHVIDAGCGDGSFGQHLESLGFVVSGFDASATGVDQARQRIRSGQVAHTSGYEDLRLVFGRGFDAVTALEVIEHLYAPREFLRQIARLLEPGAPLVISTPYHGYLKNLVLAASGKLDGHFTALWDGGHIKFFSPATVRRLLEDCGYRVLSVRGAGRLPWLWKSMVVAAVRENPR